MSRSEFVAWMRERRRTPRGGKALALAFALLAPPVAWSGALLASYALSSHACYPDGIPRASLLPGWGHLATLLAAVDAACLVATVAGFCAATFDWREAARPVAQSPAGEIGPPAAGAQRAISAAAMMTAAILIVAVAVNGISLWLMSTCSLA